MQLPEADRHFHGEEYQKYLLNHALRACRQKRVALDVGAHVGFYAKYMEFKRVYAFEPDPENFRCLRQNVPQAIAIPCALGNRIARARLYRPNQENSGTAFLCDEELPYESVQVPELPLDTFRFTGIDLIKVDIQGGELAMLQGGRETILACRPIILIEQSSLPHTSRQRYVTEGQDFLCQLGMSVIRNFRKDILLAFP